MQETTGLAASIFLSSHSALMRLSRQQSAEATTSKGAEDPEATCNLPGKARPILRGRLLEASPTVRSHSASPKKVCFVDLQEGKRLCQVFEYEKEEEWQEPVVKRSHCCAVF